MQNKFTFRVMCFLTLASLLTSISRAEPPPPARAVVECRAFPTDPPRRSFTFNIQVTFEGEDKPLISNGNGGTTGLTGEGLAELLGDVMEQKLAGLKLTVHGTRLVIDGWKNPKTGTFHRVKDVQFSSPDLPGAYWPAITLPGKKK